MRVASGLVGLAMLTLSSAALANGVTVAPGGSYAGISNTSTMELGTTATLLGGSNTGLNDATVGMVWRDRAADPALFQWQQGGEISPNFERSVFYTDVLTLSGVNGVYVLQMDYLPYATGDAKSIGQELWHAQHGEIQIMEYVPQGDSDPIWKPAVWQNILNNGTPVTGFVGSWADANSPMTVGSYGADVTTHEAWVVLDHNGTFAAVPVPSAALLALAGLTLMPAARRLVRR